jgi:gas vesicle protein
MQDDLDRLDLDVAAEDGGRPGGFLGLAFLALAAGAGAALLFAPAEGAATRQVVGARLRDIRSAAEAGVNRLQRELRRREERRRRERRTAALIGFAAGAGLAALLMPTSGPDTRRRLAQTLSRGQERARNGVLGTEPQPAA